MTRNDKKFVEATLILDALNHYRAVLADDKVAKEIIDKYGEEFYSQIQSSYFKLTKKYEKKFEQARNRR